MSTFDSLEDSNCGLLEAANESPIHDGPCCTKCDSPMDADQMVCRTCGFYPSLGITVELDAEWEAAMNPELADPTDPKSALEEVTEAVPTWVWPIVGVNAAIIAASIAGRLLLPAESVVFEFWGVAQVITGMALVAAVHITCFVVTASSNTDIGIPDIVVSPLKAWIRTIQQLPERLWLVVGGSSGVTLALCAALIVGGIQWHRLWDWGIEAPTKTSLVQAIASAAGNGPANDDTLEDAIADFAGAGGETTDGKPNAPAKPKEPKPRIKTDCLIIGFQLDDFEQISTVLIAAESNGRLVYAGELAPELDTEQKLELKHKFTHARAGKPLVTTGRIASWVQPRFPCRVSYTEQAKNGRLLEMEWEELLPEIELPW